MSSIGMQNSFFGAVPHGERRLLLDLGSAVSAGSEKSTTTIMLARIPAPPNNCAIFQRDAFILGSPVDARSSGAAQSRLKFGSSTLRFRPTWMEWNRIKRDVSYETLTVRSAAVETF